MSNTTTSLVKIDVGVGGTDRVRRTEHTRTGLRIGEIMFPKEFRAEDGQQRRESSTFVIFRTTTGGFRETWKGCIPKIDMLHEYDVRYVSMSDGRRRGSTINQITAVYGVRRMSMSFTTLMIMVRDKKGAESQAIATRLGAAFKEKKEKTEDADAETTTTSTSKLLVESCTRRRESLRNGVTLDTPLGLRETLTWFGREKWYIEAEARYEYFEEWYSDQLKPHYDKDALRALGGQGLRKLVRTIVTAPWRACFWWLAADDVLLEELDIRAARELGKRLGGDMPTLADAVASAYHGIPFGPARDRGDSYVSVDEAVAGMGREAFDEALRLGVVAYDRPPNVDRVRSVGDALCEERVVRAIIAATCESSLADDEDAKLVPVARRWPDKVSDKDGSAPELNPDQRRAVYECLSHRLHVVSGKPGTGKTTYVMRAVCSAFARKQVVVVAFTGFAATKLRAVVGSGVTAHHVVDLHRRKGAASRYAGRRVLVIEEASNVSMRLMLALLTALGPTLRRIYMFGDHRQMPPPGGGASLMRTLVERYTGTPIVSSLTKSMRITDQTGAFARDLDRICGGRLDDGFEWARDVSGGEKSTGPPFWFVRSGRSPAEDVATIRRVLAAYGIADPDSAPVDRWQVMVHTNDHRRRLARAWFESSRFGEAHWKLFGGKGLAYQEHEFHVGERIMFTRNCNGKYRPHGCPFASDRVSNGTMGTLAIVFDEDTAVPGRISDRHEYTGAPKASGSSRRWIGVVPHGIRILLDYYGRENIERVPPTTVSKNQGQEADVAILLFEDETLTGRGSNSTTSSEYQHHGLGRSGVYTACSRGRRGCIVVSELIPGCDPSSKACPSPPLRRAVLGDVPPKTTLHTLFPDFGSVVDTIACPYTPYPKRKTRKRNARGDSPSSSEEEADEADEEEEDESQDESTRTRRCNGFWDDAEEASDGKKKKRKKS